MSDSNIPPKTHVKTEGEWEEAILDETLDDALKPDGSIDFDKLRTRGVINTLADYSSVARLENK